MVKLQEPDDHTIRGFLAAQAQFPFTHAAVGATAGLRPHGYAVDHTRIKLGAGGECFTAAKTALACWRHFPAGWLKARCFENPMRAGGMVTVVARSNAPPNRRPCRSPRTGRWSAGR